MPVRRSIAFTLFAFAAAVSLGFGLVYLLMPRFMPYHEGAIGIPWASVPREQQTLFLALMRVAGGGFLTSAVAMGILLAGPFRAGAPWARLALLAVGLCMALPAAWAVWLVATRTPASPPWIGLLGAVALLLAGYAAAGPSRARARPAH